jgi:hypothetical protein
MFSTKRPDGRAEWRVVFDFVENLDYGTLIPFEQLEALLETNVRGRTYAAVSAANRKLWGKAQRSLGVVRGAGYRVLMPEEHELQAGSYQRGARRRLNNAVSVMKATDLSRMDAKKRDWMLQVTAGMVLMAQAIDHHAKRLAQHADLIADLSKRISDLENS